MPDLSLAQTLMIAGSAVAGALLAMLTLHLVVGSRLKMMQTRLDKVEKARSQANDMLMQARRQAEALQKEVLTLRKPAASTPQPQPQPHPQAQPQAVAARQVAAARPLAAPVAAVQSLSQASLEQSQALARARERTKQLLEEELDRTMVLHRPAGGFADTQPLSQM